MLVALGLFGTIVVIFAIAIGVVGLLSSIFKWILYFKYKRLNRTNAQSGKTGEQTAKELIDRLEMPEVKVKKLGFWGGLFFGNHFNAKQNTIKLRKNVYDTSSITSVSLAAEKVALAEMHKNGDKRVKSRQILSWLGVLAPYVFVPIIVLGIILDYAVLSHIGVFSIVFTCLSLAYFVCGCVAMSLNVKLEKKASDRAEELLKTSSIMNEDELAEAHSLFKTYLTSYIIDYIYTVMYVIWLTIRLIFKLLSAFGRK